MNIRDMGNFVVGMLMPETPILVIIMMFTFVCGWAVKNGVKNILRCGFVFVITTMVVLVLNAILLAPNYDFNYFLPAFTLDTIDYVHGVHNMVSLPFAQIILFMIVVPDVRPQKKIAKAYIWGFVIGALTILFVVLRNWAAVGPLLTILTSPTFQVMRIIDVFEIFTRMEILYAIVLLFLLFFKVSLMYYATVLCIAQIFGMTSYHPLVIIMGIFIVGYSELIFDTALEQRYWGENIVAFFLIIFELILPVATLIITKIKSKRKIEVRN